MTPSPADTAALVERLTDDEIRQIWRKAGGRFYGPHVEHAAMEERKFLPFMRALISALAETKARLAVPEVWSEQERDGMAQAYAKASTRHGHYESIFAAAAWLLRHRSRTSPPAAAAERGETT